MILTQDLYVSVRGALDTELTENELPDSTIGLPIYRFAAEQDVLERDPQAESRTGDELQQVKVAAVYFCAARLAPAVVRLTSLNVTTRDISYQKATFDPASKSSELRQYAEEALATVLEPENPTPGRPTILTVASGDRGR